MVIHVCAPQPSDEFIHWWLKLTPVNAILIDHNLFFSGHCVSQVCLSHDGIKSSDAESQTKAAESRRESIIHKESADVA